MADCVTQETMPESEETQTQQPKFAGKEQEEKKEMKKEKKKKKNKKKKKKKRVTVTVGTTGGSECVAGLIASLRDMEEVVKGVNFREIPYNIADMDQVEFDYGHVFILCHSINNRRLSITDVDDSLYDQFLRRARRTLGKSKVNIVAYDFRSTDLHAEVLASKMKSFEIKQPTACRKSSAVVFAGQCASSPPELPQDQFKKLYASLEAAVSPPWKERLRVHVRHFSCHSTRR